MTTQETMDDFYGSVQYDKPPLDFMEQTQDDVEDADEESNNDEESETKADDTPDLPPLSPDMNGMEFTDDERAALEMTDNEAAKILAFAVATPEKRILLRAKEIQ